MNGEQDSDSMNPNLTVNDLKYMLENAEFSLTCASLKRFSKLEKDVLCTTNSKFKESCPKYCAGVIPVPTFVLRDTQTTEEQGRYIMRDLNGSYMLQPSNRLKAVSYRAGYVADEDDCNARCADNIGCVCKLSSFNAETKECILDCPTDSIIAKHADIAKVPFMHSPHTANFNSSEKVRN